MAPQLLTHPHCLGTWPTAKQENEQLCVIARKCVLLKINFWSFSIKNVFYKCFGISASSPSRRKLCLPFSRVWICSVLTALLFFILIHLTFSILSLLHLKLFFYYPSSSIFLSNPSAPSETNQNFQLCISVFLKYFSCPDTWRKNIPLKQKFLKKFKN